MTQNTRIPAVVAWTFNVVSFLIALWAGVFSRGSDELLVLLIALPWLAVALGLWYPGLLRVSANRGDWTPNVRLGMAFSCVALVARSRDFHLFSFQDGVWLTAPVAIVFFLIAAFADQPFQRPFSRLTALLMLATAYGYGCGVAANALLDRSPANQYSVRVTDKRVFRGRHTSYQLHLEPWGPRQEPSVVYVSSRIYYRTQVGNALCVTLRNGAFAVSWYAVDACK